MLDILAGKVRLTASNLLSVPLLALSPSLVGPVGRSTLGDDFASDSAPASALHGASPSAPTHNTKSTRLVVTVVSIKWKCFFNLYSQFFIFFNLVYCGKDFMY